MIRSCLFCAFLALLSSPLLHAQTTFLNTYTDQQSPNGLPSYRWAVLQGGQIALGAVRLTNANNFPGSILLTPEGEVAHSEYFSADTSLLINAMSASHDGGFLMARLAFSSACPVTKVDITGHQVWGRQYSNDTINAHLEIESMEPVEGGYLLLGQIEFPVFPAQLSVVKIDEDGAILWQNSFQWFGSFIKAIEGKDGSLFVLGNTLLGAVLAHFSANGELIYLKRFPTRHLTDMVVHDSGDLMLCGALSNQTGLPYAGLVIRIKPDASVVWQKTCIPNASISEIEPAGNNGFLLLTPGTDSSPDTSIIFKIDAQGNLEWAKKLAVEGKAITNLFFLQKHPQSGYIAAGVTRDAASGPTESLVMRIDDEGNLAGCCREIPLMIELRDTVLSAIDFPQPAGTVVQSLGFTTNAYPFQVLREAHCSPNLAFSLSDTTICPNQCIDIQFPNPTPGVAYTWTFEGGTPATSDQIQPGQVCFNNPAKNKALITLRADGCISATDTLHFGRTEGQIPNAFTPDNDGTNDVFRPLPECPVADYHFQVFDRWGNKVFDSRVPGEGWDGRVSGTPAAAEVYVWQLEYVVAGEKQFQRGEVTLLR